MAVESGVNAGFVTTAPTSDPSGSSQYIDDYQRAQKFTSPSDATGVTEIGWWCDTVTEDVNFEVAIYDHDSENDLPGNIIHVERTNAKGTTAGWKTASVNWNINSSTIYWLAVQVDTTVGDTRMDFSSEAGGRRTYKTGVSSLTDPWQSDSVADGYTYAIYAVYTTGGGGETTNIVNISDGLNQFICVQ